MSSILLVGHWTILYFFTMFIGQSTIFYLVPLHCIIFFDISETSEHVFHVHIYHTSYNFDLLKWSSTWFHIILIMSKHGKIAIIHIFWLLPVLNLLKDYNHDIRGENQACDSCNWAADIKTGGQLHYALIFLMFLFYKYMKVWVDTITILMVTGWDMI